MQILGLERAALYQPVQVFDPTTAAMVLSALKDYYNAVKGAYDEGRQNIADFYKTYGDFMSPIQKDMEWYDKNVTGKVRDTINNLYANGIDPLRSAEGRAAVAQLIYSMPTGQIAQLRLSAEAAKEYIKNRGKLEAQGLYNPDAEENYLGFNLNNYNTLGYTDVDGNQIAGRGVWGRTSPIENKTMDEIIEPIIKNLDYTYDEARTKQANDGNDYYTVSEDRIRQTIADAMADLTVRGTMGGYYYDQALRATGDPEAARALYTDWLVNRGKDHLKEKFTPNEWKKMAKEHQYRMAEKAYKPGTGNGGRGGSLTGTYDFATDIYDKGLNNIIGNPGGYAYELGPGGVFVNAERYFQGRDDLVKAQRDFGVQAMNASRQGQNRYRLYRDKYTHTTGLSGEMFAAYLQRDTFEEKVKNKIDWKGRGVVRVDRSDLKRMRTVDDMITNTAGYTAQHREGNKKLLEDIKANPEKYLMGGNNIGVYGAFNKPGRYQNDFIVAVYDAETGKRVGEVAYDSYISSEDTSGGFYERNKKSEANTSRSLRTRQFVTAGSTAVNKKLLSLTRPQKMPSIYPYIGDEDDYEDE